METRHGDEHWFYALGDQIFGPVHLEQLQDLVARGELRPNHYLWCEGTPDWVTGWEVPGMFVAPLNRANVLAQKTAAGICGVLLGAFGVHKFILGYSGAGLMMLLVTLLTFFIAFPVMQVIGMIEGVIYLVKNNDEFYRDYIASRRDWF